MCPSHLFFKVQHMIAFLIPPLIIQPAMTLAPHCWLATLQGHFDLYCLIGFIFVHVCSSYLVILDELLILSLPPLHCSIFKVVI